MAFAETYFSEVGPRIRTRYYQSRSCLLWRSGNHYAPNWAFPLDKVTFAKKIDVFNVSGPREDYFIQNPTGISVIDRDLVFRAFE